MIPGLLAGRKSESRRLTDNRNGPRNILHTGEIEAYDGRPRPSLPGIFHTDGRGRPSYEISHFSPREI